MASTSIELFDHLLKGERVSRTDIEHMVAAHVREDLHLDWKGGKLIPHSGTTKSESRANKQKIRAAVAGFANASGGVLVLGVNGGDVGSGEAPWTISQCPRKVGKHTVVEWLEDVLVELRPNLKPRPLVAVDDGDIVLIPVERSDLLVQCIEPAEGVVHYLRFFGSTQKVPPYLLADLLLGRRQRPQFELEVVEPEVGPVWRGGPHYDLSEEKRRKFLRKLLDPWPVVFKVKVTNTGLVWADSVRIGVVHYGSRAVDDTGRPQVPGQALVNVPDAVGHGVRGHYLGSHRIEHCALIGKDLAPFECFETTIIQGGMPSMSQLRRAVQEAWHPPGLALRLVEDRARIHWRAALYVTARNAAPTWFQLTLAFSLGRNVLDDHTGIKPANGQPDFGLRVFYQGEPAAPWARVAGVGDEPLSPWAEGVG